MERLFSKIIGTLVFHENIRAITSIKDLLINPDTGKIEAFIVNESKNLVILPMDIIKWSNFIKISDNNAIIEGEEIIKVTEIQKKGTYIYRNKVETKKGVFLGKVFDFTINDKFLNLQKIYVAKGFLGLIRYDSRIISAEDIIEITSDKIIVKDSLAIIKEKILVTRPSSI